MNRTATANGPAKAPATAMDGLEMALVNGDLSRLNPEQRLLYYRHRCEAAGLDPRTQPFEYITLSGKLTLYARKAASDQLIANRRLSVSIRSRSYHEATGLYTVECQVRTTEGQEVDDVGVVSVLGLKGEALANGIMKAVTKAKRRTVLSACGLGMLDETEVETIPDARAARPAQSSLPSPRPFPAVPAGRLEPAIATPEPAPQPAADGFWSWLQQRVDEVNNDWAAMCAKEKKPHEPLIKHVNEALNGVITVWLENDLVHPDQIKGSKKDTRSTGKMRNVIDLACEEDEHATRADFDRYFDDKWSREAAKLGVNMDAELQEAPGNA